MVVRQLNNSKRNSRGSWVPYLLVIVQKVGMGHTRTMWSLKVVLTDTAFARVHSIKLYYTMLYICVWTCYWLSGSSFHLLPFVYSDNFGVAKCFHLLSGYENGVIQASAFRTFHTPLNKQVWSAWLKIFVWFHSIILLFIFFFFFLSGWLCKLIEGCTGLCF